MKQLTLIPVSTPEAFTPKEIAAFFFKHGGESTIRDPKTKRIRTMVKYNCMRCVPSTVVTIKKNTGYQNLAQHVYTFHKDHLSQMRQAHGPGKVTSIGHAVSDKALNVFGSQAKL
ncbi:unnamed protein product, partial [Aphanomyces euteiches]